MMNGGEYSIKLLLGCKITIKQLRMFSDRNCEDIKPVFLFIKSNSEFRSRYENEQYKTSVGWSCNAFICRKTQECSEILKNPDLRVFEIWLVRNSVTNLFLFP